MAEQTGGGERTIYVQQVEKVNRVRLDQVIDQADASECMAWSPPRLATSKKASKAILMRNSNKVI